MNYIYETLFICPGDIVQEKAESALEKVKAIIAKADGVVSSQELWGHRRLAYAIKKQRDGYYIYLVFKGSAKIPALLNQHFRVTDSILRGMTVKVDPRYADKIHLAAQTPAVSATESAPAASVAEVPAVSPSPVQ